MVLMEPSYNIDKALANRITAMALAGGAKNSGADKGATTFEH